MKTRFVWIIGLAMAVVTPLNAADMILNEYNAVRDDLILKDGGFDSYFGSVTGNGRNWFELVVITDHLDARGWKLVWTDATGGAQQATGTLTLSQDSLWSDLRSGTIITFTGFVTADSGLDTDASYDPCNDDWWIQIYAGDTQYVSATANPNAADGVFSTSQTNWQLTIKDASNVTIFGPCGEGVFPASGVGNDEVFKLEDDPSALITPTSNYNDGVSSSFGHPNRWSGGASQQDFSELRDAVACCAVPNITSAQSVKTHAGVGDFGIDLAVPALAQVDAVECRLISAANPMRIVVTFDTSVVAVDGTFNAGAGQEVQLSSTPAGTITVAGITQPAANKLEIALSAVPNASCLRVLLHNVACDAGGGVAGAVMPDTTLSQRVLLCDVVGTGNGLVESNDISFTKGRASLGTVDGSSFRADYDTDGTVSNSDVSRSKAAASLSQSTVSCP